MGEVRYIIISCNDQTAVNPTNYINLGSLQTTSNNLQYKTLCACHFAVYATHFIHINTVQYMQPDYAA